MKNEKSKKSKKKSVETIGKLPPRYSFILNQYVEERLSKCPKCNQPTHQRKFPLFIHIENYGPIVQGFTCRYCTRCELIVAHQHELEEQLARSFLLINPRVIGNKYLVVGTVDRKVWQQGMKEAATIEATLNHLADFKEVLTLEVKPAGWYRSEE
ncbi:MAG: hypothetical protein AB1489_15400 [Acidobacteriota bacterium]